MSRVQPPFAMPRPPRAPEPVADGIWREDPYLVMLRWAKLPARCIKCGGPPDGRPLQRRLSWHEPALYLLILAGILVYVLVALVVQKTAKVEVCLCREHREKRGRAILAAWLLLLATVGLIVTAIAFESGWPALLAIIAFFACLVSATIASQLVKPKKITDEYIRLSGAGPAFLAMFPWPDGMHDPAPARPVQPVAPAGWERPPQQAGRVTPPPLPRR